jgi:hypothetical protein
MNPNAIKHYQKWLRRQFDARQFYMALGLVLWTCFFCFSLVLDASPGNRSSHGSIAINLIFATLFATILTFSIWAGTQLGT